MIDYNQKELEALVTLKRMKRDKKYTALSLWPPKTSSIIEKENNIMYINEGRDGKFEGISSAFYDSIVCSYDSREISYAKHNK
jgi:hypothetical protein